MALKLYSKKVSFIKALTWRFVASVDTTLIAYFFTGSLSAAFSISILEVATKTFLFYGHERLWLRLHQIVPVFKDKKSTLISLIKAISWRFIGSLDTMIISFFITEQINVAFLIAITELVTKIVLYFFHERFWIGLTQKRDSKQPPINPPLNSPISNH